MPRCLHLHKVPRDTGFCAVCGARVLPDWVWLCLCALPLSLMYATAISSRAAKPSVTAPPPVVVTVEVTRIVEETHPVEVIRIITATEPAPTPTRRIPTVTLLPTWTPTPSPTPTASQMPTATLYPRLALLSNHDLYVIAKGAADDWVLKQEPKLDEKCSWFKVIPQEKDMVALLTCYNRYVTAPKTGMDRADWVLRQEISLEDCGKFTVHDLGNGEIAIETCTGRYFTAGDGNWPSGLQWLVVAETKEIKDWEKFTLQPP